MQEGEEAAGHKRGQTPARRNQNCFWIAVLVGGFDNVMTSSESEWGAVMPRPFPLCHALPRPPHSTPRLPQIPGWKNSSTHLNSAVRRLKPLYRWLSVDTFFR